MNDVYWVSKATVLCSACGISICQTDLDKVTTFVHAAHAASNDPVRTRMFLEQALMLLGEKLVLTNEV